MVKHWGGKTHEDIGKFLAMNTGDSKTLEIQGEIIQGGHGQRCSTGSCTVETKTDSLEPDRSRRGHVAVSCRCS